MQQFIGCDAHKKFSVFVAVNEKGQASEAIRVEHDRRLYREFLSQLPEQSPIAIEASGHYGWLVDEATPPPPKVDWELNNGRRLFAEKVWLPDMDSNRDSLGKRRLPVNCHRRRSYRD